MQQLGYCTLTIQVYIYTTIYNKTCNSYTGPTIKVEEEGFLKDVKVIPNLAKAQFTQSVMEAFSTLFPPPRYPSTCKTLYILYCVDY